MIECKSMDKRYTLVEDLKPGMTFIDTKSTEMLIIISVRRKRRFRKRVFISYLDSHNHASITREHMLSSKSVFCVGYERVT